MVAALAPLRALRPHEMHDTHHALEIMEAILTAGAVLNPILVDSGSGVVLDGHHRLAALRALGARYAPVLLVDYMRGPVVVSSWRRMRVTKSMVVEAGLTGRLLPPKTSRHILLVEPRTRPTPLSMLLGGVSR